jgi:hypothetical protein
VPSNRRANFHEGEPDFSLVRVRSAMRFRLLDRDQTAIFSVAEGRKWKQKSTKEINP